MQFYRTEPTALSSWRLAVLMGANTRTYKFALGHALLTLATEGREQLTLRDIAVPYASALVQHAARYPQAPGVENLGEADYLKVLEDESAASTQTGAPTDRLIDATIKSMPVMVMQKFHNLRGIDGVPHRFYEFVGKGKSRGVLLTPELREVADSGQVSVLGDELSARWALVESAFDARIGPSLVRMGVVLSPDGDRVLERVRRSPVASSRAALIGFQHGRCFYCYTPITEISESVHADHVYPFSLLRRPRWGGPELDSIWNLVVACSTCNLRKTNRLPTEGEVQQLIDRNEAIISSPHPLRRTVELLVGRTPQERLTFYGAVDLLAQGA